MVEGLGLRLGGWGCSQGSLGLSGGAGLRQEADLLVDGATKIVEGLADVGRVIIGLVGVLGAIVGIVIPVPVNEFILYATS
jgi:hypothetical protein